MVRRAWTAAVLVSAAAVLVYFPVLSSLGRQWASDEMFARLPGRAVRAVLLLEWRDRRVLAALRRARTSPGSSSSSASLLLFVAGGSPPSCS